MMYRPRQKPLAFSLALVLGLLVIAEVALQILAWSSRSIRTTLSVETIYAAAPDSRLVWRGNPEYPGHDELGFRNPRVPGEAAVVALGDSQTYGSKLTPDEAWPRQLERRGDLPTYNMAFPGWGPLQSFRALDDALALKPRLVVMALFAGNDLVDSFTFVYHRERLEEFKARDQAILEAVDAAEDAEPWDSDGIADQNPITEPRRRPGPPESAAEFVERYSRLYGLGNAVRRAYVYYQRHPFWQEPGATLDTSRKYLPFDDGRLETVLDPSYRLTAVDFSDARVVEGLRITLEAIDRMDERSAAHGVEFAVLLIPTKELVLKEAVYADLDEVPTEYALLVENEERLRQRLQERLTAEQIPFIDTVPALRQLVQEGKLPYSKTKDGHLNRLGQQTVAELVKSTIDQRGLLAVRQD